LDSRLKGVRNNSKQIIVLGRLPTYKDVDARLDSTTRPSSSLIHIMALKQGVFAFLASTIVFSVGSKADSLADVDHIVLFMQENRAFDHYFVTMLVPNFRIMKS
jgi:hypothetical protein